MTTDNQMVNDAIQFAEADMAVEEMQEALIAASARSGETLPELNTALAQAGAGASVTKRSPEADQMVTIYNRMDGTASQAPVYMLRSFLRRRFAQENWIPEALWKTRVFTIKKGEAPVQQAGAILCDFNPESPSYAYVNAAGVSHIRCSKNNIPSQFEKNRHMRSYHQSAAAAVEEFRTTAQQGARDDAMMALLTKLVDQKVDDIQVDDEEEIIDEAQPVARGRGRPRKEEA